MSPALANIFRRLSNSAPLGAALIAVLVLVPALCRPALRVHDEGHFLLAAETIRAGVLGFLVEGMPPAVLRDEIQPLGGTLYFTAKPGHIALLAAEGLLLGGLTARKAIFLNVLCHAATAGLLVALARRRFGSGPAAVAGAGYAVAPLAVFFASGALGVTTSAFFVVLAAWLLDCRRDSAVWPVLGGAAATMAVACHYNAAPSVLAVLLAFGMSAGKRRVLAFVGGGAASALALQGATMAADHVLRFAYPEFRSWWGELHHALFKHHLAEAPQAAGTFTDGAKGYGGAAWLLVVRAVAGGLVLPAAGTLAAAVLRPGSDGARSDRNAALVWALLPLAVWTLYPWKVDRTFVVVAPGMAFALAAGARALGARHASAARHAARVAGAALVVAASAAGALARLAEPPPPIPTVIAANEDWISSAPRGTFNGTSFHWKTAPLWKWYLGRERVNAGRPSPGVDFARFDSPFVAAIDPMAGEPDPNFAAQTAEFADAQPFGAAAPETKDPWFFVARDGAAREAVAGGR